MTSAVITKSVSTIEPVQLEDGSKVTNIDLGPCIVSVIDVKSGWRWSKHVKPKVNTESCQKEHRGYLVSGKMVVHMDGEAEPVAFEGGTAFHIPAGHDGWCEEDGVMIEFTNKDETPYAVKSG